MYICVYIVYFHIYTYNSIFSYERNLDNHNIMGETMPQVDKICLQISQIISKAIDCFLPDGKIPFLKTAILMSSNIEKLS